MGDWPEDNCYDHVFITPTKASAEAIRDDLIAAGWGPGSKLYLEDDGSASVWVKGPVPFDNPSVRTLVDLTARSHGAKYDGGGMAFGEWAEA